MGQRITTPYYDDKKRIFVKPNIETLYKCRKCLYSKNTNKWICSKCSYNENIILSKKTYLHKSKQLKETYKHDIVIQYILLGILIIFFLNITS
jgi:hypothetical protein